MIWFNPRSGDTQTPFTFINLLILFSWRSDSKQSCTHLLISMCVGKQKPALVPPPILVVMISSWTFMAISCMYCCFHSMTQQYDYCYNALQLPCSHHDDGVNDAISAIVAMPLIQHNQCIVTTKKCVPCGAHSSTHTHTHTQQHVIYPCYDELWYGNNNIWCAIILFAFFDDDDE